MAHLSPIVPSAGLDLPQICSLSLRRATSLIWCSPVEWMAGIQSIPGSLVRPPLFHTVPLLYSSCALTIIFLGYPPPANQLPFPPSGFTSMLHVDPRRQGRPASTLPQNVSGCLFSPSISPPANSLRSCRTRTYRSYDPHPSTFACYTYSESYQLSPLLCNSPPLRSSVATPVYSP